MSSHLKLIQLSVILIFSLCCINSAFGQANKKRIDSLYFIARDMTDLDSSELMIEKLLKEIRASNYNSGTINLVLLRAVNLYNSGKFDQALKVYQWD